MNHPDQQLTVALTTRIGIIDVLGNEGAHVVVDLEEAGVPDLRRVDGRTEYRGAGEQLRLVDLRSRRGPPRCHAGGGRQDRDKEDEVSLYVHCVGLATGTEITGSC